MKNILKALAGFQQNIPIIHKDSKGYGYTYTNLATIIEKINPLLKKYGLGFYQPLDNGILKTVIYHIESGETIESNSLLPLDSLEYVEITKVKNDKEVKVNIILGFEGMNKAQAYGSLITYFRRYALSSILGLVTDADADARNKRIAKENRPLPKLEETDTVNWNTVKQALKDNYTIEQIRTKWSISEQNAKKLQS